jgi:hypothetical protein
MALLSRTLRTLAFSSLLASCAHSLSDAGRRVEIGGPIDETCTSLGTVRGRGYDRQKLDLTNGKSTYLETTESAEHQATVQVRNEAAKVGATHVLLGPPSDVTPDPRRPDQRRVEIEARAFRCSSANAP